MSGKKRKKKVDSIVNWRVYIIIARSVSRRFRLLYIRASAKPINDKRLTLSVVAIPTLKTRQLTILPRASVFSLIARIAQSLKRRVSPFSLRFFSALAFPAVPGNAVFPFSDLACRRNCRIEWQAGCVILERATVTNRLPPFAARPVFIAVLLEHAMARHGVQLIKENSR